MNHNNENHPPNPSGVQPQPTLFPTPEGNTLSQNSNNNNNTNLPMKRLSPDDFQNLITILYQMKNEGLSEDPRFKTLLKLAQLQKDTFHFEPLDKDEFNTFMNSFQNRLHTRNNIPAKQIFEIRANDYLFKLISRNPNVNLDGDKNVVRLLSNWAKAAFDSQLDPEKISKLKQFTELPLRQIQLSREERIQNQIQKKTQHLKKILAREDIDKDPALKRRALIELKSLNLLTTQRKLRENIALNTRNLLYSESTAIDPTAFKRIERPRTVSNQNYKTGLISDTSLTKTPNSQNKHSEFLDVVMRTQRNFREFYANQSKKTKKVHKELINHYSNEAKKLAQELERQKRARLLALKENNEDAYYKLLQETKNERLNELIKSTDSYLETLSQKLALHKTKDEIEERKKKLKAVPPQPEEHSKKEEAEGKSSDKPDQTEEENKLRFERNKHYYTLAHTITENINEQPELLVGGKLKSYQLIGLQWLVSLYNNKLNGILADEMGLGKTIQTLSLITYLMEKKNNFGPFLITVPLSTISNWQMECKKWAPAVIIVTYTGTKDRRREIFRNELQRKKFNILLTSYEYVMHDKADLGKIEWEYIIVDEGHRIKNKKSKLSTTLRSYMSRHRLLLTGTPLQNDLSELWSLLNFLLPDIFGSSDDFDQWFNAPFSYTKGMKTNKNEDVMSLNEEETMLIINRLHKVLRPFLLRRLKIDVEAELPDKIETVIKCDMSAMQKRMYKNMVDKGTLLIDPEQAKNGRKNTTKGFNNTLMQLQKICNHPYLFNNEYLIDEDLIRASGKFQMLDTILPKLHTAGHRVLIFNQMTHIMTILEEFFELRGYKCLRLDGSTKSEERAQLVTEWNKPDSPYWLFILSTKAGGLGLNLQTADTVIMFDTDWNPQMDLQAQDRAHRIGSKKEVRVYRFITHNSIEEKILERAAWKLDVDAKVIQAGMFNEMSDDQMRRTMLETLFREDENKEEVDVLTNNEEINELIARTSDERQLYAQIDVQRFEEDVQKYAQIGKKPPPRLMTFEELPDWMNVELDQLILEEEQKDIYGRGKRSKEEKFYGDLTDNQFDKMLEGKAVKPHKRRQPGISQENILDSTAGKRRKNEAIEFDDDDDDDEDDDDDKPKKKKLGRPKKGDESKKEPKKRGRKPKKLNPYLQECTEVFDSVVNANSALVTPFLELPSKRDYPAYYQCIKNPISLDMIQKKLGAYPTLHDYWNDIQLLAQNARTFNMENSDLWRDAGTIRQLFFQALQQKFPSEFQGEVIQDERKSIDEMFLDME